MGYGRMQKGKEKAMKRKKMKGFIMKFFILIITLIFFSCSEDTKIIESTVAFDSCSSLSLLNEIEKQVAREYNYRQFKSDVKNIAGYTRSLQLDKKECIANYVGECNFGVLCIFTGSYEVKIDGFGNNDTEINIPIAVTKKYSIKHGN